MTKKLVLSMLLLGMATAFCGSTEVKETVEAVPEVADGISEEDARIRAEAEEAKRKLEEEARAKEAELKAAAEKLIEEFNKKLTAATMHGFGNGKVQLTASQEKRWVNKNIKLLKEVAEKLPNGYTLELRGHADSTMAPSKKYVVITRSDAAKERADYAQTVLEKNGVSKEKTITTSKSDKEMINPKVPAVNRRVTFHISEN